MQQKHRKNAVIAALIVLVLVQGTLLLRRGAQPNEKTSHQDAKEDGSEKQESPALTISGTAQKNAGLKLEQARRETVQDSIQVTGSVQPNEARLAHVRLLSRGRIEKVNVRVGDRVRKGQTLLDYDNIELADVVARYIKASSDLKKDEAQAEVLKRAYERAKTLTQVGALAGAEEERRKAEYDSALTSLNTDRAEVARARQQLARFGVRTDEDAETSHTALVAPFDGVVTEVKATVGELKSSDEEVFTIADLSTVWVQADVYQRDIAAVKPGQHVRLTIESYPERYFAGRVTYISDVLDEKTRTAKVRCEVENPRGELKVGMFATVLLPSSGSREVLIVPEAAVQLIQGKPFVFVQTGEDRFEKREVTLGTRANDRVEVKKGIRAGEHVVTEGSYALKSEVLKGQIGGEGGEEK